MPQVPFRNLRLRLTAAAVTFLAVACTGPTTPKPIVVDLVIQSVSPSSGLATGGTELTIRGTGFASGTAVSIGGRPATDVTVRGTDTITAKTPASGTAGAVDVIVTVNGRTATLANGFKYEVTTNSPPIIKSIVAQGSRVRQPANFADYGETIRITADVEDAQTPPAQLAYQWLACGGAFSGTGPQVQWTAPTTPGLPLSCTIELVVSDGSRVGTGSIIVRVHDSVNEVQNLALLFLEEFADSTIPAATTVRNFSDSCRGKSDELAQVADNRNTRIINSHMYGPAKVTLAFGGACGVGSRAKIGDACVVTPAEWRSTVKETGQPEVAKGTSYISGIYRDSRWWLCDSTYVGASSLGLRFLDIEPAR